jgi:hypothetical protein
MLIAATCTAAQLSGAWWHLRANTSQAAKANQCTNLPSVMLTHIKLLLNACMFL